MNALLTLFAALALTATTAVAQPRVEQNGARALDQTANPYLNPNFAGAVDPNLGPLGGYTPPPPPAPSYSGEWVYYLVYQGTILPEPGFLIRYPATKTCVSGNCDPTAGASLPDVCDIDRAFLGGGWLRSSCPRRVVNDLGLPSWP